MGGFPSRGKSKGTAASAPGAVTHEQDASNTHKGTDNVSKAKSQNLTDPSSKNERLDEADPVAQSISASPTLQKTVFDLYQIFEDCLLGEGSFAKVLKAAPIDKNRKTESGIALPDVVAVKKIAVVDDVTKRTVQKEISILKEVHVETCVAFYESFYDSKNFFLVMELMQGGELFDYIVAKDFLSESEAASITKQMAMALDYLCQKNIVHRDIKPENILFSDSSLPEPCIKLTDFGLADRVSGYLSEDLTAPCGTPGYVAPEVLKMRPYGPKVDTWSLGVIVYILLCGYPPFYSEDQTKLFDQIKCGDFVFQSPYWDKVSQGAKTTVTKLLVVQPGNRQDASGLLEMPWVANASEQSKEGLGEHVMKGIDEVRRNERLKKVILGMKVINAFKSNSNTGKQAGNSSGKMSVTGAAYATKLKEKALELEAKEREEAAENKIEEKQEEESSL